MGLLFLLVQGLAGEFQYRGDEKQEIKLQWPNLHNLLEAIVAKSHCFTVRLKILGVVSHQTLIISLQNWVKGSLIFNDIYYSYSASFLVWPLLFFFHEISPFL